MNLDIKKSPGSKGASGVIEFLINHTRRGGVMYDTLWTNFNPKEESLLSYKYVGKDNTDRQRIKRKIQRLVAKIEALPYHEQQAIVTEIASLKH